jgi:hypothetical protein
MELDFEFSMELGDSLGNDISLGSGLGAGTVFSSSLQ